MQRLDALKIKIDAIDGFFASGRKARFAFQEATMQMKTEMGAAIHDLQELR